jgi:hypothetical protein
MKLSDNLTIDYLEEMPETSLGRGPGIVLVDSDGDEAVVRTSDIPQLCRDIDSAYRAGLPAHLVMSGDTVVIRAEDFVRAATALGYFHRSAQPRDLQRRSDLEYLAESLGVLRRFGDVT